MTCLEERVQQVQATIAAAALAAGRKVADITLVAATKTQTSETIRAALAAGVGVCGENRVQELCAHLDDYAYDGAELHFFGHLQTNKVRQVVGRVDVIESVDSLRLLHAIDACAARLGRVQDILFQVNIAQEESKDGLPPAQLPVLLEKLGDFPHTRLRGLMAIPPISHFKGENRPFFAKMHQLYVDIRTRMGDNVFDVNYLSMGMSRDYEDAILEGATHVRVGTALFGPRAPLPPT